MIGKKITSFIAIILFIPLMALAGRYNDNGNATVTDNVTGLMWQMEDDNSTYQWEPAITYCEGLVFALYDDWRLPNIKELRSIVDNSRYSPTIDTIYFPNTKSLGYWSSTTYKNDSSMAWYVDFSYGNLGNFAKTTGNYYVRCVRGGE